MTTFTERQETCFVCRKRSRHQVLTSTYTPPGASHDLDLSPPPMRRNTMQTWIQRCSSCGYCAADISEAPTPEGARNTVALPGYRERLDDPAFPLLANSFRCAALIQGAAGNHVDAAWSVVHAAWVCDDGR